MPPRRPLVFALAAASLIAAGGGVALATDGGTVAQACYDTVPGASTINTAQRIPCRFVQQTTRQAGATCRIADNTDDTCSLADGRHVGPAEIAAYQQSWVHHALTLQRQLDADVPLYDAQIVHTHNSFNASAYSITPGQLPSYYPTLTNQDPNQVYSISDQLNMDVRFIEMDLHWVPSPYGSVATHGYWVTLCHGDGQQAPVGGPYVHVGCTADRPAQDGFAELRTWLTAHPSEFLFVYLENQLYPGDPIASQEQAHDTAASLIQSELGSLVYRPSGVLPGQCATLPYGSSVDQLRASGAHVILVGNCGPGAGWSQWVFTRGNVWDESGDPSTYSASNCAHDEQVRAQHASFRRFFEDSTVLATAMQTTSQITAPTVTAMVRCGVNIIGMDQLTSDDPRLAALVWSWAPGQPSTSSGDCALQGSDSRFRNASCREQHPFACRVGPYAWRVTPTTGGWRDGAEACAEAFPGSTFDVPRNGYDNALLRAAAGSSSVWLAYTRVHGTWMDQTTQMLGRAAHGAGAAHASHRSAHRGRWVAREE